MEAEVRALQAKRASKTHLVAVPVKVNETWRRGTRERKVSDCDRAEKASGLK